jgi:hypothetical protein
MSVVRVCGDLEFDGSLRWARQVAAFPDDPVIGQFVMKDNVLYGYQKIGDLETWYPYASKTKAYVHTQGVASTTWTVNHNLGVTVDALWYQIKSQTGDIILPFSEISIDENSFQVTFSEPEIGTLVVVAPETLHVPSVQTNLLEIGDVLISPSGIFWNGVPVVTEAPVNTTPQVTDDYAYVRENGQWVPLLDRLPYDLSELNTLGRFVLDSVSRLGSETHVLSFADVGNGVLLAGTAPTGQVWRSTDSGASWSLVQQLGSETRVFSLADLGNGVLLAGTRPTGQVWRSTDSGASWSLVQQLGSETRVFSLADLGNGVLLAGTRPTGQVWRSTDSGASWSLVQQLGSETNVWSFADVGNGVLLAGTAPTGQVYRGYQYVGA